MGNNVNNLLPVFMKLEEATCLVVGGGKIALQKIYQLIDSKAMVTVVSPEIVESIRSLPLILYQNIIVYFSFSKDNIQLHIETFGFLVLLLN